MTTKEIINKALEVMNGQDWYWYLSDYQVAEMKDKAYSTMRKFVELVASINDSTVRKGGSRNLVGITIQLSNSEEKELFIRYSMQISSE